MHFAARFLKKMKGKAAENEQGNGWERVEERFRHWEGEVERERETETERERERERKRERETETERERE